MERHFLNEDVIWERPFMTFNIRVGRGVQDNPKDVLRVGQGR